MNPITAIALTAVLLLLQSPARPEPKPCSGWQEPFQIGNLPPVINESSGLAVSRRFPGRMYHVNDSGDTGRFFVTGMRGENVRTVQISGFKPEDVEALAVGPCGANKTCIFVADVGDNNRNRKNLEVMVIEETSEFRSNVKPKYRVKFQYPGSAHDAEGFAVHPDGSMYILTKSMSPRLYKLPQSEWTDGGNQTHTLQSVTELRPGGLPTDLSISDDGNRFLVLTYLAAVEYDRKFSPRAIKLRVLPQQESVSYLPGSRSFIYTTERARGLGTPIMRSDLAPCDN